MTAMIISSVIFIVVLTLIFTEKMNRSITAIAGAALMVGIGTALEFYSQDEAVAAIDFNTLGLLFGMMILVALLEPTGFFKYVAVRSGQLSRGHPWRLMVLLALGTSIISMFLNNLTAAVLVAPVTILLSELLGVSPIPYLMTVAFSAVSASPGPISRSLAVGSTPRALRSI